MLYFNQKRREHRKGKLQVIEGRKTMRPVSLGWASCRSEAGAIGSQVSITWDFFIASLKSARHNLKNARYFNRKLSSWLRAEYKNAKITADLFRRNFILCDQQSKPWAKYL